MLYLKSKMTIFVLLSAFLGLVLSHFAFAQQSLTPEQRSAITGVGRPIYCDFVRVQRQFGLRKFYSTFDYKRLYEKLQDVLSKPKYKSMPEYFKVFRDHNIITSHEDAKKIEQYMQLQLSAFKELGLTEKELDIQHFDKGDEREGQIKSLKIKSEPNATAELGYAENLLYFKLEHRAGSLRSESERVTQQLHRMQGLYVVLNNSGVFAILSPLPIAISITKIEEDGGKPSDSKFTDYYKQNCMMKD